MELPHFHRSRVAVVGDLMLDEYRWGHVERISPEAPVPILHRVDVPTTARSVYDVTGAGDTAIATFAAAIAARCDRTTAVGLANLCAGIKVGKRGTACVSLEELQWSIAEGSGSSRPAVSTGEVSSAEDHARPLARTP
jgi:bifunctional ADP-heptose synthase (sugar kinase/adenylyltransferase)